MLQCRRKFLQSLKIRCRAGKDKRFNKRSPYTYPYYPELKKKQESADERSPLSLQAKKTRRARKCR